MKKNWKIIVGTIFLVGGFECARSSDMGAAALGIIIGIALIVWWILGRKKPSGKHSEPTAATPAVPQKVSSPAQLASPQQAAAPLASARPTPLKGPSFPSREDGAPETYHYQSEPTAATSAVPQKVSSSAQLASPQQAAAPLASARPTPFKGPSFPSRKDGAPEAYRYRIAFAPAAPDVVLQAVQEGQWYLSAKIESGDVHLFMDEIDLGILPERADMMTDWLKRGDPYIAAIEADKNSSGFVVTLVFYRDKQKYNAHREQTIVALTGYKSEEKQDAISFLDDGEELEAEEDSENEGRVYIVSRSGDRIGSLPKKYARMVIDDGAALIVFDHEEPVEDSDISKPYVKIYW